MKGFKCKTVLHKMIVLCSGSETEQINPILNARFTGFFFFSLKNMNFYLRKKKISQNNCFRKKYATFHFLKELLA